ncbi:MAG: GNAT family N-acetyltransferase, partial [Bacilli bacterium]
MIDLSFKPNIVGNNVILRPFKEEDFPFMEACILDAEVTKFTGSTGDYDRETTIQWYSTRNAQSDRLDLAIVDREHGIVVGEVVVNEYDAALHRMNFRILIGQNGRNRGLGSEATKLIVDYVFSNTTLNALTLGVYDFNPRAKRVYEKVGFVLESVDADDLEFEGEWIDSINMVLTSVDWEKNQSLR